LTEELGTVPRLDPALPAHENFELVERVKGSLRRR
jgi:hypothetical protein